jgi:hypothetical protein
MDPFERHGINRLSPSSLALYRRSPALWCLKYLYNIKDIVGAFAWRGRAVELAIDGVIFDGIGDEEAIERAKHSFEAQAQGEISPEIDKERQALSGMVRRAAAVFRQLGQPEARQQRVEVWIDGIEVPVTGFCDFVYRAIVWALSETHTTTERPAARSSY